MIFFIQILTIFNVFYMIDFDLIFCNFWLIFCSYYAFNFQIFSQFLMFFDNIFHISGQLSSFSIQFLYFRKFFAFFIIMTNFRYFLCIYIKIFTKFSMIFNDFFLIYYINFSHFSIFFCFLIMFCTLCVFLSIFI